MSFATGLLDRIPRNSWRSMLLAPTSFAFATSFMKSLSPRRRASRSLELSLWPQAALTRYFWGKGTTDLTLLGSCSRKAQNSLYLFCSRYDTFLSSFGLTVSPKRTMWSKPYSAEVTRTAAGNTFATPADAGAAEVGADPVPTETPTPEAIMCSICAAVIDRAWLPRRC